MTIANSKEVETKMTSHIWLNDVWILVLFVRITWLMTNTCCESKFCNTVEPWCSLSHIITLFLFIKFFRQWISNDFVILENIWIKTFFNFGYLLRCICNYFFFMVLFLIIPFSGISHLLGRSQHLIWLKLLYKM